jgi:ataxia telangiectasia mutated family protein
MLGSERMELVDLAYQTLRNLNGATNDHDLSSIASYPSTFKPQINLLGKTPTSVKISTTYALKDIGKHVILTPSTTHERWLSDFSSYLASVLGREDAFFSLILPVLHASSDYASRLLPHLVKEVLLQRPSSGSPLPKPLLSSYLQSVLQQPSTAVEIKRSVIDIVLHLRHSTPEKDSSPLAYNEWLEIDYLLLADAAIHSRAYSTALLFLELGHEDSALERSEPENRILYEIYANIEDPDGFYGIKSHDVRSSLVRRFHHEKQWDRAFAFHGADARYGGFSTGDQASSVTGVLQSLHSFGFDSMAMSFFDNTRSTKNGQRTMPTELGLDLAWRTGNWDLPIDLSASTIAQASGSSLYAALKAIHRERDPGVVQETIRSTIVSELSRMHSLGIESMTDLREVKTTLLCLREIERWSEGRMQEKLQGGELGDESPFRAFSEIFPYVFLRLCLLRLRCLLSAYPTASLTSFDDIEKIEAVRSSLLDSIPFDDLDAVSSSYKSVQQARKSSQLFLSERARDIGRSQVAINACTIAQKIDAESEPSLEVSYEFANVLWMQNEHGLAIDLLKQVIERSKVGGKGAKSAMKAGHLSQLVCPSRLLPNSIVRPPADIGRLFLSNLRESGRQRLSSIPPNASETSTSPKQRTPSARPRSLPSRASSTADTPSLPSSSFRFSTLRPRSSGFESTRSGKTESWPSFNSSSKKGTPADQNGSRPPDRASHPRPRSAVRSTRSPGSSRTTSLRSNRTRLPSRRSFARPSPRSLKR